MKNYKLDVVRYNNEDVIATSGVTSGGGNGGCGTNSDIMRIDGPGVFDGIGAYKYNITKWAYNGTGYDVGASGIFTITADVLQVGHYYHQGDLSECTDFASHNLPN